MSERLFPLSAEQAPAVDPEEVVWLSAAAGTGKTQVLSARVLRLLLQPDVHPAQILCLTFTKAGAAEMASRINRVLASWVRASDNDLFKDLEAIGAPSGPRERQRARTLFASVLDCPGGGLRIDTIHAFAQWLLAAFPGEAGLSPGARAMEDRDRDVLLREVLAELLVTAERTNDTATLDALSTLSIRLGPDAVEGYLLRCAEAREAWFGPGGWQSPIGERLRGAVGLAPDAGEADLIARCADAAFASQPLRRAMAAFGAWKAKTGAAAAATIGEWLSSTEAHRLAMLPALRKSLVTNAGAVALKTAEALEKIDPGVSEAILEVAANIAEIEEQRTLLTLVEWLAPVLELGRRFAVAWDEAKQRAGFVDFDDQIRRAAYLLTQTDLAEWIRYKLDRQFDHILVDEAQDTNAAQWQIIDALTEEFFAGAGAHGEKVRTLFVVGDYKQAIFRFQGTSPENFERARGRVRSAMSDLAENVLALRGREPVRSLREPALSSSYRSARPILDFVDRAIERIGYAQIGLSEAPPRHRGQDRPGLVTMWRVLGANGDSTEQGEDPAEDEGEEAWLSRSDRQLADRIARQVRQWIDQGYPLVKDQPPGTARAATAGDIMVLVRKRRELAGLIVGRLHAHGVPVAGVDRLRLGAPLAVRDLMAALRFAAQPYDDLNLASLLVSPLLGWSQDDLLDGGYRPDGVALWDHLRRTRDARADAALEQLQGLLQRADFEPPQALLHWLLTGPWQGRRRLVTRLGVEANDPIDELLNAAGAFAANGVPSLHLFIRWFDASEGELKREAAKAGETVRVMTVHGAKGLQAPIVILADAAGNPRGGRSAPVDLPDPVAPEDRTIPLPPLSGAERVGPIARADEAVKAAELQEHWRLLYVAMTRAEEALYIAGALTGREQAPSPDSWYARLEPLFAPEQWQEDLLWGARAEFGEAPRIVPPSASAVTAALPLLPPWLERPPRPEQRPPRPLAPSALGDDLSSDPPFPAGTDRAAARGTLLHRLLERLPAVPPQQRRAAAEAWLARNGHDFGAADRTEMIDSALRVIAEPAWARLFSPAALAEAPIAATVGDQVVAGTIDRLLIEPERILLVDFKTARRPPPTLDDVPVAILRQMAAYAAALEATYPGRPVEAALLYTQVPRLIALPEALLTLHKQALLALQ